MITVERLPAEEFKALGNIEEGYIPDPEKCIVIVGKEDGQIVSRMFLLNPYHLEGTWIREDKRNGLLAARMLGKMESEAKKMGLKSLFSYVDDEEVGGYLSRLGYVKSKLTVWIKCLS